VGVSDVPGLEAEVFACYCWRAKRFESVTFGERWEVVLGRGEFELFTFVPVRNGFAAIGLTEKMNSRAAVISEAHSASQIEIELRDGGEFLALSDRPPRSVTSEGRAVGFTYAPDSRAVRVTLESRRQQRVSLIF
jgi:hypothetical protein